jgi:hypothetical protein
VDFNRFLDQALPDYSHPHYFVPVKADQPSEGNVAACPRTKVCRSETFILNNFI